VARAKVWDEISNIITKQFFKETSSRACRKRYTLIMNKFKQKNNSEKKASGIECDYDELDNLLQDLYDLERDSNELQNAEKLKQRETERANREKAEMMRKRCLETMGETETREEQPKKKRRTSKPSNNKEDVLNYLEKKRTEEKELREREFRLNPCRPVPDNNRDFAMLI